jgi:hypothetical protein
MSSIEVIICFEDDTKKLGIPDFFGWYNLNIISHLCNWEIEIEPP